MEKSSVIQILDANKIDYQKLTNLTETIAYQISPQLIPNDIVEQILLTQIKDVIPISQTVNIETQIIRCKSLVFNPLSTLNWTLPETENTGGFVAIAAQRLVLNFPNKASEMANLKIIADDSAHRIDGVKGATGATGTTSGQDDGKDGGTGGDGNPGQNGRTYSYPNIYIFYNEIVLNNTLPSIVTALRIEGTGVQGGDGGRGGDGGAGGQGSRGTPGDRDCVFGICSCASGPGRGGNGGRGGSGGRGGDAGRGGNGASLFFIGPASEQKDIDKIEMILTSAPPGTPGFPGSAGGGGQEGGGGSKPFECVEGGHSGRHGGPANPSDLGFGASKNKGMDGAVFTAIRNNSDLF